MNVTILMEIKKELLDKDIQYKIQFLQNIGNWVGKELQFIQESLSTQFLERIEPNEIQEIDDSLLRDTENEILDTMENNGGIEENRKCGEADADESGNEIVPEVTRLEDVEKDVDTDENVDIMNPHS